MCAVMPGVKTGAATVGGAVSAARAALTDAGWPKWNIESDRVAVILGNAIGGEKHYKSSMRIQLPEVLKRLQESATLRSLSPEAQRAIVEETRAGYLDNMFEITEDTMPGELANVIAGRVANLFNLRGPNFTTDAACASGLAALSSAVHGLVEHDYDAVINNAGGCGAQLKEYASMLQEDPAYADQLIQISDLAVFYLAFAHDKAPFDNVHARRAFNAALDRGAFIQQAQKLILSDPFVLRPDGVTVHNLQDSTISGKLLQDRCMSPRIFCQHK